LSKGIAKHKKTTKGKKVPSEQGNNKTHRNGEALHNSEAWGKKKSNESPHSSETQRRKNSEIEKTMKNEGEGAMKKHGRVWSLPN
jgi:hypothetical protein